jgi:hypothetical protein
MIVGFSLPKGLPCPPEHLVRFTSGGTFERAEQTRRGNFGQQKRVDVIGHNHPSPEFVVANFEAAAERVYNNTGNILATQVQGAKSGSIKVAIHPDKCLSRPESRRRIPIMWQAAVQTPGHEKPLALQIDVWEAATGFGHIREVGFEEGSSLKQACDGMSAVAAGTSACATCHE